MVDEWRRAHEHQLLGNWSLVQRPEPPAQIEPLHGAGA
jgi:hypothetical protein